MAFTQILLMALAVLSAASASVLAVTFTIKNNCDYTIWPATLANANQRQLSKTGFELAAGQSSVLHIPAPWAGRFWARTGCSGDTGRFVCATGDCGTGKVSCDGRSGVPPATLVEPFLAGGGQDFYDISLVDGFNIPASIAPQGGSGKCASSSCRADVNARCLPELQQRGPDGKVVACKSACTAFQKPEYCCTTDFNDPNKCQASNYSKFFKDLCPQAYSYAYNDNSSTFTCNGGPNYVVTFCP